MEKLEQEEADASDRIMNFLGVAKDGWKKCGKHFWIALVLTILIFFTGAARFYIGHTVMGGVILGISIILGIINCHGMKIAAQAASTEDKEEKEALLAKMSRELAIVNTVRCGYFVWTIVEVVMLCSGSITPTC